MKPGASERRGRRIGEPGEVISRHTMKHEDTIPEMMFLLEELDPEQATCLTTEYSAEGWPYSMAGLGFGDPFDEVQEELAPSLWDDLVAALDKCAPEGYYFGTCPDQPDVLGFLKEDG